MTTLFVWGAPASVDGNATVTEQFEQSGRNAGNLLIGYAALELIKHEQALTQRDLSRPEEVEERCTHIVIPAANFLWKGFDFGFLADFLAKTTLPITMIGLGAQGNSPFLSVPIPPGTRRMVEIVAERTCRIGVRGYYTAEALAEIGVHNIEAIGCPSYYLTRKPQIEVDTKRLEKPRRIAVNASRRVAYHSFDSERMKQVENKLLADAIERDATFFAQDELEEISMATDAPDAAKNTKIVTDYFSTIEPAKVTAYFRKNLRIRFDVRQWLADLSEYDFSCGCRFHGNLMALLSGTPSVTIAHDMRTRELCALLGLPYVNLVSAFDIGRFGIDYLVERADFSLLKETYPILRKRFQKLLEDNGLEHRLGADAESAVVERAAPAVLGAKTASHAPLTAANDSAYRKLLDEQLPPLFWFRDYHTLRDDRIVLYGHLVLGRSAPSKLNFELAGQRVQARYPLVHDTVDTSFWFIPPERRFGFEIEAPAGHLDIVPLTVTLEGTRAERQAEFTLWQFMGTELGPVPPLQNIERVSGKGANSYTYFNNGYSDAQRFLSVAARHGCDLQGENVRILDWGCGCGRLTRHFLTLPNGPARVHGIDIDRENIAWCQDNLLQSAFATVPLFPPTFFDADSFDIVIANSVLSHLREAAMNAWLAEVRRILKPGGLALLSYHGNFSLAAFISRNKGVVQSALASGFNDSPRAPALDAVISDPEYYRNTYMTDDFAQSVFERYFSVVERVVGVVSRYQNLAVLRNEK